MFRLFYQTERKPIIGVKLMFMQSSIKFKNKFNNLLYYLFDKYFLNECFCNSVY